jgi:hypothetical protein
VVDDGFGYMQKVITRQGVGDDKYSCMQAVLIEKLDC